MGKIDITKWDDALVSKPNKKGVTFCSYFDDYKCNLTDGQVRGSNRSHQYHTTDYFGDVWYDRIRINGKFYNQIIKGSDRQTIIIIEGNSIKEVVDLAKESFDNLKGVVLKSRAEKYSINELKYMESINSRLYFRIQDYVMNNRNHPLFLIGGRGFGKTFNVMKVITKQKYTDKTPTVFIFKKNEKQEIWKPIEGEYIESADLNEVFNNSSIIVFDDIHYICEEVINKNLSVDVLIALFKNILKTSKLKIPVIMISDEMISRYAGQINNDEIDELTLMFGEVSFRKMHELPKNELRDYLNKRDLLAKLELPPITYEEFESLFEFSNIATDNFVKKFLYEYSNGSPRGFATFASAFHSDKITIDDLIQIAKKRLSNHKHYSKFLQLMEFPILPSTINNVIIKIDDEILSKAYIRFKTFDKFYSFAQEKYNLKEEIYQRIDENYEKAFLLIKERNDEYSSEKILLQIKELSKMKKTSRYLQNYKKLIKNIERDFNDIFKQIPEITEIARWRVTYDKYINTCDFLIGIKEELEINDPDFEKFWKIIPYNYSDGHLATPFLLAFNKELSEGWYYDKE